MGHVNYSHHHKALGHKSSLDHVFIIQDLKCYANNYEVLNCALNLSDQLPVSFCLSLPIPHAGGAMDAEYKHTVRDYQWDEGCRHG